ncbi:flavodoxin family protein BilS [Pseudoflavonifractor phocaeensis]|nr:flavodoxin family protein BilS [Pseudoflavonifractor phocaeensis]
MRYAVLYASSTGNTKAVAEAVAAALPAGEVRLEAIGPDTPVPAEETVFVGFWTDKGLCPQDVQSLLQKLGGRRVALFGTAGFGVSQAYFDAIAQRTEALLPEDCTLLGSWMCQGRMPAAVRRRYEGMAHEHPDDTKIAGFLANFDHALSHPDEQDLARAAEFARDIVNRQQRTTAQPL